MSNASQAQGTQSGSPLLESPDWGATDVIRRYFLHAVTDGHLSRGSRLPSERSLALRFNLPRSAVRGALFLLETAGYLERRRGSGTYVTATRSSVSDALRLTGQSDVSPAHLVEARLAIEPQFAELIVANATSTDFDLIDECNRGTAAATTAAGFREWNARLHHAIAAATRNEFLIQVFGLVIKAQRHPAWGELITAPTTPAMRQAYQRDHDAIVAALRARDVVLARDAMRAHLRHARRNLLGV